MPIYTYRCECGYSEERVNRWVDREQVYRCPNCDTDTLLWRGVESPSSLSGTSGYQMGAILSDGRKVPGHFGKDAKRRRSR